MHILLEYFFGEKVNIEDKVSKVRAFLKKANWSPQTYSLRPNYLAQGKIRNLQRTF